MKAAHACAAQARPFLKWAGGKTQLLDQFQRFFPGPGVMRRYLEPFVGSGAVFFRVKSLLGPERSVLADSNEDLINVYDVIQTDLEGLIRRLERHRRLHSKEHYYRTRAQLTIRMTDTSRAARFIYLNKTCYNGLYRVNSRGQFNVPMGRYVNPPILDEANLRAVGAALRGVRMLNAGFEQTLDYAKAGDFIYLDPPYHPISSTSYFTAYTQDRFQASDQQALADVFVQLHRRGCLLMLSNSDAPLPREIYRNPDFRIEQVSARRNINSRADRRGHISEVVVVNYDPAAMDTTEGASPALAVRGRPRSAAAPPPPATR